jgi:anti-sigma regulatory factor (Ser/Thr protein kinase)
MAGPVVEVRRHFDSSPRALRDARKFLAETIGDRVGAEENEALALALSELTTNAVVHARTDFDVVIGIDGQVRIEVEDGSTDLPRRRQADPMAGGGRGLHIVQQLCDRWGIHVVRDRKCVWCERDLPHDRTS